MGTTSPRQDFLSKLGLSHDPFATPVAEQELELVGERFYSYFLSPMHIAPGKELSLKTLREPGNMILYGQPGSGKSTLRLTLDADCRTVLDGSLVVNYNLGEDFDRPLTADEHKRRLLQALAIDLFVQVVEQFNPLKQSPDEKQVTDLRGLVQLGGPKLKRLIRSILDEPMADHHAGISGYWKRVGKAAVRYVGASPALLALLRQLLEPPGAVPAPEALWRGFEIVQGWGYRRVFILVDGLDARQRSRRVMLDLLRPLLALMPEAGPRQVYLKLFLPLAIKEDVATALREIDSGLLSETFVSIIDWNQASLQQLLIQRFRAAESRLLGLDSLAEAGLDLDARVLQAARGSPRRYLQIVSDLIDEHVTSQSDLLKFSRHQWEQVEARWRG
ncbi:MAG: hypothetical protein JXB85_05200 [Anaerolineales bacterium]|nr:hypothetical protein [Anaerolineales bacterium]